MKLSTPKQITFWLALILAVLGVIFQLVSSIGIQPYAIWFVVAGFVLLAIGNLFEGI